jgi:signal transduction histidine kinase
MRSLYGRLALVLALLFMLLGAGALMLLARTTEGYRQETNQRLNLDLASQIVQERQLFQAGLLDREALEHIFHMLMVVNPRIELYLLDPDGRVLAFSAPPGRVQREQVDLTPIERLLAQPRDLPLLGDDPRSPEGRKVFSVAPVFEQEQMRGYLYVILAGAADAGLLQPLMGSEVLRLSALALGVGLLFALLAALILFRWITRPLRQLTRQVAALEHADFRQRLPDPAVRGSDEIAQLSRTCQAMAERIRAQVSRLEDTDAQRRELIANVSHDLRTPLASLQGYLETLQLKQQTLDDEQQQRYLRIALRQCRHLSRLVSDLLELAKLEANEFRPLLEPFSLPELVQDVAQKFELRAQQQGVQIRFRCAEQIPFVRGDIALMERVFDNLLANALRHTPAGGQIHLAVLNGGAQVKVEVIDTGCGIAPEDLPHIFDRLYRPSGARKDGGAGLGLAIAQRIMALHGSVIRAQSRPGGGSAFAFELAADTAHTPS